MDTETININLETVYFEGDALHHPALNGMGILATAKSTPPPMTLVLYGPGRHPLIIPVFEPMKWFLNLKPEVPEAALLVLNGKKVDITSECVTKEIEHLDEQRQTITNGAINPHRRRCENTSGKGYRC